MSFDNLFKNIEKKSGVKMQDVFKLADSIKHANFKDEKTVRDIVQKVAALANRSVPKEKEDELVKIITKDPKSIDMDKITKMVNKK